MAKNDIKNKDEDELIVEIPEEDVEAGMSVSENEEPEDMPVSEIPIEKFLKDPSLSSISDDSDVEETTNWCPVCSEHTIFVDKVCTVCGFTKSSKKSSQEEDGEDTSFEITPNEDMIDELNGYEDVDDSEKDDI